VEKYKRGRERERERMARSCLVLRLLKEEFKENLRPWCDLSSKQRSTK
jgi:hypothetical protein